MHHQSSFPKACVYCHDDKGAYWAQSSSGRKLCNGRHHVRDCHKAWLKRQARHKPRRAPPSEGGWRTTRAPKKGGRARPHSRPVVCRNVFAALEPPSDGLGRPPLRRHRRVSAQAGPRPVAPKAPVLSGWVLAASKPAAKAASAFDEASAEFALDGAWGDSD